MNETNYEVGVDWASGSDWTVSPMTDQQALYALVKAARPHLLGLDWLGPKYYPRQASARVALFARGIYGKRTMRAKLREADSWRTKFHGQHPGLRPVMRTRFRLHMDHYAPGWRTGR